MDIKHEFDSVIVSDLIKGNGYSYATIDYCLKKGVGYSQYTVDFIIETKCGITFSGTDEIIGGNNSEQKCFQISTKSYFNGLVNRNSTKEKYEEIAKIYRDNISSLTLRIRLNSDEDLINEIKITSFVLNK